MAIKKDYNWLSSKANKEALEEKLLFFKEITGLEIFVLGLLTTM